MLSRPDPQKHGEVVARSPFSLARREFLVAMTNPKAVLLFTAFVPQFIAPADAASFTVQLIVLGTIYVAVEFVAAMAWAFAGSSIRTLRPSAKRMTTINRASGFMMLGAAGVLASTSRA
jgi:threonine/homoserine/homoserine lactone efflux protein